MNSGDQVTLAGYGISAYEQDQARLLNSRIIAIAERVRDRVKDIITNNTLTIPIPEFEEARTLLPEVQSLTPPQNKQEYDLSLIHI